MDEIVGVTDLAPARWVQDALPDFGKRLVGSIIPGGFDAYARILHPATDRARSTWHELATGNGRELVPLSRWEDISPSDVDQPEEGTLAEKQVGVLVPILARATTTRETCWFALWHGYGDLTGSVAVMYASTDPNYVPEPLPPPTVDVSGLPTFTTPAREFYLFRGAVDRAAQVRAACSSWGSAESPNLWWPDDRAWFVASEIDLTSTYVGGTNELVQSIVDAPGLEAMRVDARGDYA